jgi:hypothetical protein
MILSIKNAQIAVEFAKKICKEKILKHLNYQQEMRTKLFEDEEEIE